MKTIYLTEKESERILKDIRFIKSATVKDGDKVEDLYEYYSSRFNKKMEPLFGEDGSVALEYDLYNYHFGFDPEKRFRLAAIERWEKYLVFGGFAHWVFLKFEELKKEAKIK